MPLFLSNSHDLRPAALLRRGFLFLIAFFALSLAASAQSFHITSFADDITVDQRGSAHVVESVTIRAEASIHGIRRYIPIHYTDKDHAGMRTLEIEHLIAIGDDGQPLKLEQSTERDSLVAKIYIPAEAGDDKTIHLSYDVEDVTRRVGDHDELYWNVTGNGWGVAIDQASAIVHFAANASGKLKAQGAFGAFGSKDAAIAAVNGSDVTVSSPRALAPHEGLTLDVYLPNGVITQPSAGHFVMRFLRSNLILFLPPFALLVMGGIWYFKGRDPDPGVSMAPQYEPPKGMTPVECGTLIDDSLDARDITATLVDLAVRGYIRIEESAGGAFGGKGYLFHMTQPRASWVDLTTFEQTMLEGVFYGCGDEANASNTLDAVQQSFYLSMPAFREQVKSSLLGKEFYRVDPDSANGLALVGGLISIAPFVAAMTLLRINFLRTPLLLIVALALTAAIVFFFLRILPSKSVKGARMLVFLQGFKEFMERVDGDRLRNFPSDHFEKCLPYAMAFGVDQHWAKAFEGIVTTPPTWYVGDSFATGFNTWMLCSALSSMGDHAYQSFTTTPPGGGFGDMGGGDSGGGGFSDMGGGGGDFSGGGFGGGGGDSF